MQVLLLSVLLGLAASAQLPSNLYGAPNGGFGASNGATGNGFGSSNNGFGSSGNGFGFSGNGLGGPSNTYGVPEEGYGVDPAIAALGESIPGGGVPGEDYPILSSVPETDFSCDDQAVAGYYADTAPEAGCQVFHICQERPNGRQQDSFLCPNGTIFNQQYLVCDWWFNFDCSEAESFYSVNELIGVDPNAGYGSGNGNGNGNNGYGDRNGNGSNGNGNGRNGYSSNGNGANGNGSNGNGYGANGNGVNGNGANGNGYSSNGNGNGALNGNGFPSIPSEGYGAP